MKRLKSISIVCLTVMSGIFASCLQGVKYPPEPQITYLSYTETDSLDLLGNPTSHFVLITFEFTDGDGNLGEAESSVTKNLFVSEYGILNGEKQAPVESQYRMPDITPKGQNKSLKGEVDIDIVLFANYPYDSVQFEIYIKDRSNNESNIITTPIIPL